MSLHIYIADPTIRNLVVQYIAHYRQTDSGFDLISPEVVLDMTGEIGTVRTGFHVAAVSESGEPRPCLLLPRSSISKTPLRLANSIGLIDMGYRGEVMAKVDVLGPFIIHKGDRIFQICQHNFLPWKQIVVVEKLEDLPAAPDNRGAGGFGSTGK